MIFVWSWLKRPRLLLMIAALLAVDSKAATIRLVSLEFPPLSYLNAEQEPDGASVQIVRAVFARLGHTVVISVLPWPRSLRAVQRGEVDGIFTAYRKAEREIYLDYGREVLIDQVVAFYARRGPHLAYTGDLQQLSNKHIGVTSTISYGHNFDRALVNMNLQVEAADDFATNVRKLLRGRLDLIVSNRYSAEFALRTLDPKAEVAEVRPLVESVPSYIAFAKAKQHQGLRDAFDQTLRAMKADGSYQRFLSAFALD